MSDLETTLSVWRPSQQWTTLFRYDPYAPALWALLYEPNEELMASERFGAEWPRISAEAVITDHVAAYQTSAGKARERLVERLEPVRVFGEAWRAFSLTRALALSLAALPAEWPLRFDASRVTLRQGERYSELLKGAIRAASRLSVEPPGSDSEAVRVLVNIAHGMNPTTALQAPDEGSLPSLHRVWPADGSIVGQALLGVPVNCPSSYVDAMTRARRRWEAGW
jgi:hypothetical protein